MSEDLTVETVEMTETSAQSDSAIDPGIMSRIKTEVERRTLEISEQFAGKTKAHDRELAKLRRKLSGQETEPASNGVDTHGSQLSREDVASLIRVGHLRSSSGLGSDALESIAALELSPGKEEAILEALASNQPASKARDAREITRGTTSAPRNSAQLPATQKDFLRLRHTDPKRFKELAADDGFDATALPRV